MITSTSRLMQQVDLVTNGDNDKKINMTTWVNARKDLKEGVLVKLEKDERLWFVVKVYKTLLPFHDVEVNRNWDNNNYDKHDGTALKDRK